MRTKKQILHRLKVLYYIFFAMVIAGIVVGVTGRDSKAGFKDGMEDSSRNIERTGIKKHTTKYYYVTNDVSEFGYTIPIIASADSSKIVRGRINTIDIEIESDNVSDLHMPEKMLSLFIEFIAIMLYLSVFVIIFIILASLTKSVRNDDIFSRNNISLTRVIGILFIAATVCEDLGAFLSQLAASKILEGSEFSVYLGFPISFSGIIFGIMILFISEIFAIGYDLTQEQKLTI